jgi:hypothetical protein
MFARKTDGTRLRVDDPELDPVCGGVRTAERTGLIHDRRA